VWRHGEDNDLQPRVPGRIGLVNSHVERDRTSAGFSCPAPIAYDRTISMNPPPVGYLQPASRAGRAAPENPLARGRGPGPVFAERRRDTPSRHSRTSQGELSPSGSPRPTSSHDAAAPVMRPRTQSRTIKANEKKKKKKHPIPTEACTQNPTRLPSRLARMSFTSLMCAPDRPACRFRDSPLWDIVTSDPASSPPSQYPFTTASQSQRALPDGHARRSRVGRSKKNLRDADRLGCSDLPDGIRGGPTSAFRPAISGNE